MRLGVLAGLLVATSAHAEKPLEIPMPHVQAAPWVKRPGRLPRLDLETLSPDVAIAAPYHQNDIELAIVIDRDGTVGPIRLPAHARWLGAGTSGRLLCATADGTLYAAASARSPHFTSVFQAPGAKQWDAAGEVIVAGADKRVFVSTDGGKHFQASDVAESVWGVFARKDGIAVVVPFQKWPRVSKDGGRTWIDPPKQPADDRPRAERNCPRGGLFGLGDKTEKWGNCWTALLPARFVRSGDWIGAQPGITGAGCDGEDRCHTDYTCGNGVLAADGETWVATADDFSPWAAWRTVAPAFEPTDRVRVLRWPALASAPATGKSAFEEMRACAADPAAYFKRRSGGAGGIGGFGRGHGVCDGLDCLEDGATIDKQPVHALLGDATATRPPTMISMSEHGLALTTLPCMPNDFDSIGSGALLRCQGQAFFAGSDVRFVEQKGLPDVPMPVVQLAEDGTILVAENCRADSCRAFVRAPTSNEWREVTAAGARAYRVLTAGRALAVTPAGKPRPGSARVDLRGISSKPVIHGMYWDPFTDRYFGEHPLLPVVKACYEARLAAMGAGSGIVRIKMDVDTSGKPTAVSVEGTTDKAFAGCVEDGVRLLPILKPPQAMHCERVVGYASAVQAFALVSGGKTLVDDAPISGGLRDLRVDKRGRVVATFEERGKPRTVTLSR